MVDIDFNLNQSHIVIQANLTDLFRDVINRYFQKALLNPNSVTFITNGKVVNPSESIRKHMSTLDLSEKKLNVLVNMVEQNGDPKELSLNLNKLYVCNVKSLAELLLKIIK